MFDVTQSLVGLDAETFRVNGIVNARAFVKAVAGVMGLSVNDIEVTGVSDRTQSSRRQLSIDAAVDVSYTVKYTVSALGYIAPQAAYNHLISTLSDAISNEQFLFQLHDAAVSENAVALFQVFRSDGFTASVAIPVLEPKDDSNGKTVHVGLLVGLVIGLTGAFLIAVIAYLYVMRIKQVSNPPTDQAVENETHSSTGYANLPDVILAQHTLSESQV